LWNEFCVNSLIDAKLPMFIAGAASEKREESMSAKLLIGLAALLGAVPLPASGQPPTNVAAIASSSTAVNPALASSPQAETLQAFDQWATHQDLYSQPMIAEMRNRLCLKLDGLPSTDAAHFRDELSAKLSVLGDSQSQEAEQWIAETLAVASEIYAKSILAKLPDVVDDSPSEVRAKLRAFVVRAINLRQARQGFNQSRQATIQVLREDERRQAEINAQIRASMTYSTPNLYTPTVQNGPPAYQRYSGYFNQRYGSPYSFGGVWFF
jgi:hypothetical protein